MDPAPLGKGPQWKQYDKFKRGRFIKFRKEISSKLGRKEIHQGEIRFWESIKLRKKEKAIKLEKTSTKRERKRERSECRNFHKLWENTDSSKDTRDMRFHERAFKLRKMSKNEDSTRAKSNQIEEDEEKEK